MGCEGVEADSQASGVGDGAASQGSRSVGGEDKGVSLGCVEFEKSIG